MSINFINKHDLNNFKVIDQPYVESGFIINSSFLNGLKAPEESIEKVIN